MEPSAKKVVRKPYAVHAAPPNSHFPCALERTTRGTASSKYRKSPIEMLRMKMLGASKNCGFKTYTRQTRKLMITPQLPMMEERTAKTVKTILIF